MKINLEKIKNILMSAPESFAKKSFLFSLLLILLSIFIGVTVFYKYNFLPQKTDQQITEISFKLQKEKYSWIMQKLSERRARFEAADFKNWLNPFSSSGLTE
jgi:O-antigen ligase